MDKSPLVYRIILIGVLPVIAAVLYMKGQNYDPALIDFKAVAAREGQTSPGPVQSASEAPVSGEMKGFTRIGQPHSYTKENLYEHVDGHAEYFISAGFNMLTVTEYVPADSKATAAEIQAEVFDMGKSIQAFGVLSDESGDNPAPVRVGAMGFKTSGGVNFIKGRYYVKVTALVPGAQTLKFAKALDETLPSGRGSFEVFERFPNMGKVENTKFIKEGYKGLDFLHNVVEREYSVDNKKVTVALITGSEKEIQSVMSSFAGYFRKSGIPNERSSTDGKEFYRVTDKYEGNWFLIPSGDAVFAVFGTDDEGIIKFFMPKANG